MPDYRLRHSTRARRLQIRVSPWKGVEIIVPPRHSAHRVHEFVAQNRNWILQAWEGIRQNYPEAGQLTLPERILLPAVDEVWRIHYRRGKTGMVRRQAHGLLAVTLDGGDICQHCKLLRRWLALKARNHFEPWLRDVSEEIGLPFDKMQMRGQSTRWGSCSANRTVTLNFKLLFCAPAVVRYLFIHELCHTLYLDHSRRFWQLVTKIEPRARVLDAQLGESWKKVPPWVEVN